MFARCLRFAEVSPEVLVLELGFIKEFSFRLHLCRQDALRRQMGLQTSSAIYNKRMQPTCGLSRCRVALRFDEGLKGLTLGSAACLFVCLAVVVRVCYCFCSFVIVCVRCRLAPKTS